MSDPKRIHFCHVPETEDRIVCLSCERFVNHYFCEHCGSVDLDVIEVPVEAKPLPKPETPIEKALRMHRGDLTGDELKQAIRNYNAGVKAAGEQAQETA